MSTSAVGIARALLSREAILLDRRDWHGWLALYADDAVFWVPAWLDEDTPSEDPSTQISLIYHADRAGLTERVARVESRLSVTTMPLLRTTHQVTNVVAEFEGEGAIAASASFVVHFFDPRTGLQRLHHGRYELGLSQIESDWRFRQKKILLMNDCTGGVLDYYLL